MSISASEFRPSSRAVVASEGRLAERAADAPDPSPNGRRARGVIRWLMRSELLKRESCRARPCLWPTALRFVYCAEDRYQSVINEFELHLEPCVIHNLVERDSHGSISWARELQQPWDIVGRRRGHAAVGERIAQADQSRIERRTKIKFLGRRVVCGNQVVERGIASQVTDRKLRAYWESVDIDAVRRWVGFSTRKFSEERA